MENLLNYVHLRRDIDFSIRPFNDVDMLVCADLSYVDWDGIVEKDEVSLEEACRKYLSLYSEEELKSKYTFSINLPHLIDALQDTIRYGNIKLKNYKKVYSDEDVIQFSVVTLVLPDGSFVISFSGTDGSITGWKENLMMTYSKDLPCQILAKDYVKKTIADIPESSYLFGLKKKKVYSDEDVIQVSVVTLVLPDGSFVISFSGTDGSITGWKENLMMTYKQDLPCQILAKDYVKETVENIPETNYLFGLKKKKVYPKMYLTGHSKGGNLAMYAYLKNPELQEYIEGVKSFDGPGFVESFWQGDEDISKITNYIPKDSIVGRVLNHKEQTKIMDAQGSGLVQHDTLMWSVDVKDFNYCDALTKESDDLLEYVNKLLMDRPLEEKERYCHLIGELFDRMEIRTIADLTEFSFKQALSGIKEIRQLNADEIKFMFEVVKFIAVQSAPILVKGRK